MFYCVPVSYRHNAAVCDLFFYIQHNGKGTVEQGTVEQGTVEQGTVEQYTCRRVFVWRIQTSRLATCVLNEVRCFPYTVPHM